MNSHLNLQTEIFIYNVHTFNEFMIKSKVVDVYLVTN